MKEVYHSRLDERFWQATASNGLPVCVVAKPGFARACAYLVTRYGSIDTRFTWKGKTYDTPAGVAHYLEHKMFELPDRDVMQEFSALGANPNAFTSYAATAYYFNCTEHFDQCLRLLLTFVGTPYFTQESVERERGIIGQEIRMYEDSADSRVYEDLFAAMYRRHPVRVPIAGTEQSIAAITPEILRSCYDAFYHPANMMLCVVGDVDPERVMQLVEEAAFGAPAPPAVRDYGPEEGLRCPTPCTRRQMDVAMPTFQLGFKCPWPGFGPAGARQELIGDLAAEALMGESSRLYLELYRKGLIDSSFAAGYEDMPGVALLSCGGDSRDPEAVRDAVCREAGRMAEEGVDEALFLRLKKSALGRRMRGLDSFDSLCFRLCQAHFDGVDFWASPDRYAAVTKEEIEAFLRQTVVADRSAISIVLPRQKEGPVC